MRKELVIHPLNLGELAIERSLLTFRQNYGVNTDVVCIGWVIMGGERNVLVDSGPCSSGDATKYHWPLVKSESQELEAALAGVGLAAADIDTVIFTHLHWDHCYNLEPLQNARFYVQKSEMQYAVDPLPHERRAYEVDIAGVQPPWMKVVDRMIPVDGDVEIMAGIKVIKIPGHTPGSQGVVVETADGDWVIAGDAVPLYENLRGNAVYPILPGGLFQNLFDVTESLKKLEPYKGRILPGHDKEVCKEKRYPVVA